MRLHIVLPDDVVAEIDRIAGKRGRSRYIAEAVAAAAKRDKLLRVVDETTGTLDLKKHPEWSTPEKVAQWVHDLRRTPSFRADPIEAVIAEVLVRHRSRNRVAKAKIKSR